MLVSSPGCPVFVGDVGFRSPAQHAGLQGGDKIVAVDGTDVTNIRQAADLIRSDKATPVTLTIVRGQTRMQMISQREKRSTTIARTEKNSRKAG